MTREEMLDKLHNTQVAVHLTVLESESALECIYMTSKGTKEEWIGINEWPVSIKKESDETSTYILNLEERHAFKDYQSFASFFEKHWIGDEVKAWEEYNDNELEEWLDIIGECDGIPFIDNQ